mmetsp:Transcript_27045/g.62516  ORF Transcript_27045/g.62516 Transcript_27045/m.62516 type:complete len:327 (+) Transcript_27045:135-1115(+)
MESRGDVSGEIEGHGEQEIAAEGSDTVQWASQALEHDDVSVQQLPHAQQRTADGRRKHSDFQRVMLSKSVWDDPIEASWGLDSWDISQDQLPEWDNGTVFFFDWDDTLLPTGAIRSKGIDRDNLSQEMKTALERHAKLVLKVLTAASSCGRVGIITLAKRPWVQFSMESFLLGVDWEKELKALDIPVIYARESLGKYQRRQVVNEEGVDFFVASKAAAMGRVLKKFCRRGGQIRNLISIGDQSTEAEAARQTAWCIDESVQVKTVKLPDEPASVAALSHELEELMHWFSSVTKHEDDFDVQLHELREPSSPLRPRQRVLEQAVSVQ